MELNEIIHCCECKYWEYLRKDGEGNPIYECKIHRSFMDATDFCSLAKHKIGTKNDTYIVTMQEGKYNTEEI